MRVIDDLLPPKTREYHFPDTVHGMTRAKRLQAKIKYSYGFKPEIFRVSHKGDSFLLVVKSYGMKKIR